jgi:cutinase
MPAAIAPHVAAVALFGKPSNGFLDLVDRSTPPITIGQLYSGKTIEPCALGDPVCGGGLSRAAHSEYKGNGMAEQAADFTARPIPRRPCEAAAQFLVTARWFSGSPTGSGGQCGWRALQDDV